MASQESSVAVAPESSHDLPGLPNDQHLARNNPQKLADLQPYQLLNFALFVSKNSPPFPWAELREILLDQEEDEIIPSENLPDDKLQGFYAEVLELAKKLPDIDIGTVTDAELTTAYYAEINEQLLNAEWVEWNADIPLLHNLELITDRYQRYYNTDAIDVKEQMVGDIFATISPTFLPEQIVLEKNASGTVKKVSRVPPLRNAPPVPGAPSLTQPSQPVNIHALVRDIVRELQADLIKLKQSQSLNLSERDRLIVTSTDDTEEQQTPVHAASSSLMQNSYGSIAAEPMIPQTAAAQPGFDSSAAAADGDSNASVDGSFMDEPDAGKEATTDSTAGQPQSSDNAAGDEPDHITLLPAEYAVGRPSATGHVTDAPEALEFAIDVPVPQTASPAKSRTPSAASATNRSPSGAGLQQQPAVLDNRKRTRASRSVSPNKKLDVPGDNRNLQEPSTVDEVAASSTDDLTQSPHRSSEDPNSMPSPVIAGRQQQLRSSFITPAVSATRLSSPPVSVSPSVPVTAGAQPSSSSSSRHASLSPVRSSRQSMRTRSSLHNNNDEPTPSPVRTGNSEEATIKSATTSTEESKPGTPDIVETPRPTSSSVEEEVSTPTSSPSRTLSRASRRQQQQQRKAVPDVVKSEESGTDAGTRAVDDDAVIGAETERKVAADSVDMSDAPKTTERERSNERPAEVAESKTPYVDAVRIEPRNRPPIIAAPISEFLTSEEQLSGRWLAANLNQSPSLPAARCVFEQLLTHAPAFLAHFDTVRLNEARDYLKLVKMPISARDILKYTLTQQQRALAATTTTTSTQQQQQRQVTMFNDKTPVIPVHLASNLLYVNCVSYNEAMWGLGQTAAQLLASTRDELTQYQVANKLIAQFYESRRLRQASPPSTTSVQEADDAAAAEDGVVSS